MRLSNLAGFNNQRCGFITALRGLFLISFLMRMSIPAQAFPGQSAAEMIKILGMPNTEYQSPPVPSLEQFEHGPVRLTAVNWRDAKFDPLRNGWNLQGTLIVSFDYLRPGIAERLSRTPADAGWDSLDSYSEIFLTSLQPEMFDDYLASLKKGWRLVSSKETGQAGNPYTLYSFLANDKCCMAEISYMRVAGVSQDTPSDKKHEATRNLWTRVTRIY